MIERLIERLLARRLRRIRRRCFMFVTLEFCEPFGIRPGWIVEGRDRLHAPAGERIPLASGPDLFVVLREAEAEASALFDEYGDPHEVSA